MDIIKQVIDIKYLNNNILNKINNLMNTKHKYYIDCVEIIDLNNKSTAKQSGIKIGDILIMIKSNNNKQTIIDSPGKYWMTLNGFLPNQNVNYLILRYDDNDLEFKLLEFDVKIINPPKSNNKNDKITIYNKKSIFNDCVIGELEPFIATELGKSPSSCGVMLMDIPYTSYASHYGFKTGDIILEIDGIPIKTLDEMKNNIPSHNNHNIVIKRGEMVGEINI